MVFVDILTSQLFALAFSSLLTVYLTYRMLTGGKKGRSEAISASLPLLVLGFYILVTGLFGQFAWPLPGSYNILFYDAFVFLGIMVLSFGWSMRSSTPIKYTGLLGLFAGVMVGYYGINGYMLQMTKTPIALLGLFGLYGLGGILGYPIALMIDGEKKRVGTMNLLAYAFWAIVIIASLIALFVAAEAVPAHLMSPP